MIPSNRLDTYRDNLDHPPCACLKKAKQYDIAALTPLEAAEHERKAAKAFRDDATRAEARAFVANHAARKQLADARYFNRNAAKVLFASFVMFVADAVLFVAAWVTVWRLL